MKLFWTFFQLLRLWSFAAPSAKVDVPLELVMADATDNWSEAKGLCRGHKLIALTHIWFIKYQRGFLYPWSSFVTKVCSYVSFQQTPEIDRTSVESGKPEISSTNQKTKRLPRDTPKHRKLKSTEGSRCYWTLYLWRVLVSPVVLLCLRRVMISGRFGFTSICCLHWIVKLYIIYSLDLRQRVPKTI